MKLILIRHGQTDLGLQKKYCGSLDVPLNDHGKDQSERLGERLKGTSIDAVFSSDLKRAIQTAQIAFKGETINERPCFREMDFGVIEGISYQEVMIKYPDIYKAWINDPLSVVLPQAEDFEAFSGRVLQGLDTLIAQYADKTIVLVAHGGPNMLILCKALGFSTKEYWTIRQDNAAVNIIEYHSSGKIKVIVQNDTGHLKDMEKVIP
jgi:alpha-ribazole phosphatase